VHLVVDASLSTDSWVANRRVLDVARDSLVLLAEALRTEQIPTSVAVFRSHTRRDCRFELLKEFDEDWTVVAPRLAPLAPEGYTRIGPALRHATHRLEERGARRRLLVLVSDGKPTDYDRYEGRHGIADIAKAVDEARRSDVIVHALAIDAVARPHLPRLVGRAGFEILPRPDALPRAMASLFTQLAQ
jgi:nitric oxide reductase NorD protein